MRFLQQLILLLNGINISYAFTPSYPESSKIISAPHRQLQYVRHEDEIEWIDTNFHQPPSPQQQQRQQLHQRTHQTQDYEDMVNARFSRHDRRARLRTSITYGEWEIRRRLEEEELQREREHEILMADQEDVAEELIYHHEQQLDHHEYQQLENIQPSSQQSYNQHTTNTDYPVSSISKHPIPFPDAEYIPSTILYNNVKCLIPCNDYMAREIMSSHNHQHSRSIEHHEEQLQYVTVNNVDYLIHTLDEVIVPQDDNHNHDQQDNHGRAYWLQSKLHNAIYGQVRYGTMLTKLDSPIQVMVSPSSYHQRHPQHEEENEEYWITINYKTSSNQPVAIKEMNWEHIKSQRDVLAEDPIKEVSALQYLERWWKNNSQTEKNNSRMRDGSRSDGNGRRLLHEQQQDPTASTLHNIEIQSEVSHICMPLDLLSDDVNLYSITPYCTGGRLLDQIENKSRFSEPEARYWMRQILTGLTCLKQAGVAHRDMSPENLMVHDGNVYIIDLGMCLRIPSLHDDNDNGHDIINSNSYHPDERALIAPQTPCGKWYYLSPEVCLSEEPFDGPAVDLWAAGVILFIMLTGIPPWEEPKMSDENFKLMSTGHLVQILTDRRVGLSIDAMDLLQRMFWLNPADRLSLEQVCEHPWLTHNEYNMESRGDASND